MSKQVVQGFKSLSAGLVLDGYHALVLTSSVSQTKAGKPYMKLTLKDHEAQLRCVFWDYHPEIHQWIKDGAVVTAKLQIESYEGDFQGIIKTVERSPLQASEFAKRSRFDLEIIWKEIEGIIGSMTEPLTKFVAHEILVQNKSFQDSYKKAPAAKGVHNAWIGGLLEHVWSLCRVAEPLIAHYKLNYFPELSRDKVIFGLLLHDAGKVVEYDATTPNFKYTPEGNFVNHIVLGPVWVAEVAERFQGRLTMGDFALEKAHLMHLIAAHHGKLEWGSPVKPASIEAVLVHHLDNLDATVLHALDFVHGKPGPVLGFSERSPIEGVSFYQPPRKAE